jgi:kynureninase
MKYQASLAFAQELDKNDSLANFRGQFLVPERQQKELIYFCGNSLGLQPKTVSQYLQLELEDWHQLAVDGHFHGRNPWFNYHKFLKKGLVAITGAADVHEVTPMGSLTTNLHLLMVSFFQPVGQRNKILIEHGAFPSDQYLVETQCRFHGLDPDESIIELEPQPGKYTLDTNDIIDSIRKHADQLALVLLSGVQYYTGQHFNIGDITRAGHEAGAMVGWDLAHAVGNVPLALHQDQVDFAAWCSYKYLNSGPGATAGIFVHEQHESSFDLPRFGGWWGHQEEERFLMKKGFKPMKGSDGWQLSNANVLSMAAQKASLDIFMEAGMDRLHAKSKMLTGYLEFLLNEIIEETGTFSIITPTQPEQRGAQLSLLFTNHGNQVFDALINQGIVVDWREPGTIRVAPVPLYNNYQEVFHFYQVLKKIVKHG